MEHVDVAVIGAGQAPSIRRATRWPTTWRDTSVAMNSRSAAASP